MKCNNGVFFFLLFLPLFLGLSACSSKKITYFQTDKQLKEGKSLNLETNYKENIIRFQPDDILGITVNVPGAAQSIAYDFNLPVQPSATTDNSLNGDMSTGFGRQTYQINKEGEINFPILGLIKAAGYTKPELEEKLKKALKKYIKEETIIVVTLANFKISVLGEVGRPGEISVNKTQVNIMEAIALAGDLTIYGKRDNVRLMRRMPNGESEIVMLNLNKLDIVKSPYFYLQQNDLIYVEPNKAKASSASIGASTNLTFTVISTLLSVASLIILITQ